jgi:octaprenyl-diphosphate synthase
MRVLCYTTVVDLKIYSDTDFPSYLPKLNLLYDDLFSGGKGFRAKLTQMVSQELQLPASTTHLLSQTIEFIHNSSLLHDDLIDHSQLRRGKTAAWLKYTPEYAVLAGDYLLARVMVNLSHFGNIKLIQLTSQAISDLIEGEWLQDDQVKKINVTGEQIDRVHSLKTGSLFQWCLRAPFVAIDIHSPKIHEPLLRIGHILGLLLQRSDDLLDFDIRNGEKKAVMGDLKAGYVNSFCAFLFREKSEAERRDLSQRTDLDAFQNAIGLAYYKESLQSFDQMNSRLIEEYQEQLDELRQELPSVYANLANVLQSLPQPIYWRETP